MANSMYINGNISYLVNEWWTFCNNGIILKSLSNRNLYSTIRIFKFFTVLCPAQEFFARRRHHTGEGLQNLGLRSALRAFEQEGIFIVPHLQNLGLRSALRAFEQEGMFIVPHLL
jgi:hypothetical protein